MKKPTFSKSTCYFIASIIVFTAAVIHIIVDTVIKYNSPTEANFYWYSAIFPTLIYYIFPTLAFCGLGIFYSQKQKH